MTGREKVMWAAERNEGVELSAHQCSELRNCLYDCMAVEQLIMLRFSGLFVNYAYTGSRTAIDLMEATIKALREQAKHQEELAAQRQAVVDRLQRQGRRTA